MQLLIPGALNVTVVVETNAGVNNATIGVQVGAGREAIVTCPAAGTQGPCETAVFPETAAGVNVVRLRTISWCPSCRAYNIETINFEATS